MSFSKAAVILFALTSVYSATELAAEPMAFSDGEERSRDSGRPMFVMVGRETCPICQRVKGQLRQREISRLVGNYVPIYVDIDGETGRNVIEEFGHPDGNLLPFLYILRADGENLFDHSGDIPTSDLASTLRKKFTESGNILPQEQATQIKTLALEIQESIDEEDMAQAVLLTKSLKRHGTLGQIESYADAALDANNMVKQVKTIAKNRLTAIQESLTNDSLTLQDLLDLAELKRVYGSMPELKKASNILWRKIGKNEEWRTKLTPIASIDRARALVFKPDGKKKATAALEEIVTKRPDSPYAQLAQSEIDRLNAEGTEDESSSRDPYASRVWTKAEGGKFRASYKSLEESNVTFESEHEKEIVLPLEELSEQDQKLIKSAG